MARSARRRITIVLAAGLVFTLFAFPAMAHASVTWQGYLRSYTPKRAASLKGTTRFTLRLADVPGQPTTGHRHFRASNKKTVFRIGHDRVSRNTFLRRVWKERDAYALDTTWTWRRSGATRYRYASRIVAIFGD
jgi:hypothetical protein